MFQGHVSVKEKEAAARVIVGVVEVAQFFVGEFRDDCGIASGIDPVGEVRKEGLADDFVEARACAREGPFHFVEDNPFVFERRIGVFGEGEFEAMPFLQEAEFIEVGVEYSIQIHFEEIVEIFGYLGGSGVASEVGAGKGIHEGVEASSLHGEEWVFYRVFLRTA